MSQTSTTNETNTLLPPPAAPAIQPEDKQRRADRIARSTRARARRAKRKSITESK